jgi:hypothetical protein
MNKVLRFHPSSVLFGVGVAALVLLTTSQLTPIPPEKISRVQYFARPQDMIQIREGTAFEVPAGKVLVVTALGGFSYFTEVRLSVDGETVFRGASSGGVGPLTGTTPIPSGASVVVSSENYPTDLPSGYPFPVAQARAWGYLDDSVAPTGSVLRVRYEPHPSQIVELRQGTPLTVPSGRVFVLMSLGQPSSLDTNFPAGAPHLRINGLLESAGTTPTPLGLTARSGDVVEPVAMGVDLRDGYVVIQSSARAWGYLADL